MGTFALVNPRGVVVNMIALEADSEWSPPAGHLIVDGTGGAAGDTWDGSRFIKPPEDAALPKTVFNGADFLARLTDAEYGAILAASTQSVQLARWLDIFRLRGEIDVTGATAQAAKVGLVATGLLTQERADVIFASG